MIIHPANLKRCIIGVLLLLLSFSTSFAQQFDVQITKTNIAGGPVAYDVAIPFNIAISNNGTDTINNIVIRDIVPEGYEYIAIDNPLWSPDPANMGSYLYTINTMILPGDDDVISIELITQPTDDPDEWDNTAQLVSFTDNQGIDRTGEDVTPGNNVATSAAPILDVALTKELVTVGQVRYGDTLTFMVTVINQGNMPLSRVQVKELVPEGYTIPNDLNNVLGWDTAPANPIYEFTNLILEDEQSVEFRLILEMDMVDAGAWDNYAEVSLIFDDAGEISFFDADSSPNSNSDGERSVKPGDPDDGYIGNEPVNPGYQDDHDPAAPTIYDLAIIKERLTGPPSFTYGQDVPYAITLVNQGNMPIKDIVIRDSLPCGIEDLVLGNNPNWTYDTGARIATYTLNDTLFPSEDTVITFNLEVRTCYTDPATAWTNITEIFEARDLSGNIITDIDSQSDAIFTNDPGGVPGSPTDNVLNGDGIFDEDDQDVEAIQVPDLAIAKTLLTEGPYEEGDTLDFNIRVYNQGNVYFESSFIEEFVPEGYRYEQSLNGPLGWDTSANLGGTVVNGLIHTNNVPIEAGDTTNLQIRLILELDGRTARDYYNYAHVLISRDSLGNNRNDDADSVPFTETDEEREVIPGDPNDNNILTLFKLLGEDQDDHDPANVDFFDMSLTKMVEPGPYPLGEPILFTIEVKNESVNPARNVQITDYLPCGFTFDQNLNAANMQWEPTPEGYLEFNDNDTLFPGEILTVELSLTQVVCDDADAYRNVAEISQVSDLEGIPTGIGDDQDSNPDNDPNNDLPDEDDIDDVLLMFFDLSLEKSFTTTPTTAAPGTPFNYIITVTNEGTTDATNVVVTDRLPCGLDFVSSTGWIENGGVLSFAVPGTIVAGTSIDISLSLVTQSCPDGIVLDLTNIAEITEADDPDGTPGEDVDSTPDNDDPTEDDQDDQPFDIFDLSLEKTFTSIPTTSALGTPFNYTITVTNEGTVDATNVVVTDRLPCGLDFVNSTGWTESNGEVTYQVPGTITAGTSASFTLTLMTQACPDGQARDLTNIAEITEADDPDGDPGDDDDSTPDNEDPTEDDQDDQPFDVFDLSLEKSFSNTPTTAAPGTPFNYIITVTNEGTVDASNVVVTDRLPCGLDFVSSAGWLENGGNLTYDVLGTIASGQSVDIPLTVIAQTCPVGVPLNLTNVSEIIEADDPDGNPGNDDDSTPDNNDPTEDDQDDQPFEIFDLSLEKIFTNTPSSSAIGTPFNYTLTVTNEGTVDATNVVVTDRLPCGLDFISSPGWTESNGEVTYQVPGTISAGTSASFTLTLVTQACPDGQARDLTNIAEITEADDPDGDPGDDDDSTPDNEDPTEDDQDDQPFEVFDLSLQKSLAEDQETVVSIDDIVSYIITVTNEGTLTANSIRLIDRLPCGLQFNGCPGWSDASGSLIYDNIVSLPSGQSIDVMLELTVVACAGDQEFRNVAEIFSASGPPGVIVADEDSTPNNNIDSEDDQDDENSLLLEDPEVTIGDFVFNDLNGNGLQDGNEPGIGGVAVSVFDDNAVFVTSTTTDANGFYSFELEPETYYFDFEVPEDFFPVTPFAGNPNNDSNVTGEFSPGSTDLFEVFPGEDDFTIDAGFFECVLIRGVAWYDTQEDDRRQDFENGINGLEVRLYRLVNGIWTYMQNTLTGHDEDTPSDDGVYEFCVSPGTYYVEVVMPPYGLVRVRPFVGPSTRDSDLNNANGVNTTSSFTLVSGQSRTNLDAGFYPMATITSTVWLDDNQNGLREEAETLVSDIAVQAFDEDDILIQETTTDEDGAFRFEYLQRESYYLKFEAPDGYGYTVHVPEAEEVNSDVTHENGLNTTTKLDLEPGMSVINFDAGLSFGALPVTWVDFTASAEYDHNYLQWMTAEEVNNSHFAIEKSSDGGKEFTEVGTVRSQTSDRLTEYDFTDDKIASGSTYYRLKQVDLDGTYSYSKIVSVSRTGSDKFTVYPIPAKESISISFTESDDRSVTINIIQSDGRTVISTYEDVSNGHLQIDISELSSGIYIVRVKNNNGQVDQSRFIKQ